VLVQTAFCYITRRVLVLGLSLHDIELLEYFKHNIPAIETFKKELDCMYIESSQYTALDVLRESMLLFHR
jgi:hypothetical protein